jgi:ABC-type phosphate transport system substrate-binding protein
MSRLSARRAATAFAPLAVFAAIALPATASATEPTPDINEQCSGPAIQAEGSTFQGPAQFALTGYEWETSEELTTGYNHSTTNVLACAGAAGQGSLQKPTVRYNQTNPLERGSGSCLKSFGEGVKTFEETKEEESEGKKFADKYPRMSRFPFCGTDEAPSVTHKAEMEKFSEPENTSPIETIPFAQGAEAIVVHLPAGCTASSEPLIKGILKPSARLSLTQSEIEEIYRGALTKWSQLVGNSAHNKLSCTVGSEEEATIIPVVRKDKSGTTHIFKKFLEQVNETVKFSAETFGGKGEETRDWEEVAEGSENQRWPTAAHVTKPAANGNQGVAETVGTTPSTIGYADLAVAREYNGGYFSKKCTTGHKAPECGGENKKGEANHLFWALVQNNPEKAEFADPATNKDVEKKASSNCASTVYIAKLGEKVPPVSTLADWSKVKGSNTSKTYPICGLTYDLAPQLYYPYLKHYSLTQAESKAIATSAHDYLHWMVNAKTGGGGLTLKNTDYAKITGKVQKEAELGAEEIGNTIP